MKHTYQKQVMTLAHQIWANGQFQTFSSALSEAHKTIQDNSSNNVFLLTFRKVKGELTTRVVCANTLAYMTIKGTGRPTKPGQRLFVDLAKVATGRNPIISTYQQNIIQA